MLINLYRPVLETAINLFVMKKALYSLLFVLVLMISFGHAQVGKSEELHDEKVQRISPAVNYRLFPTENMWNFIKLNTRNGQMWQVQYDVGDGDRRMEAPLNLISLVKGDEEASDRFNLYPTQNIYTFILLDQIDGRVWQVQWNVDVEDRFVIPIR